MIFMNKTLAIMDMKIFNVFPSKNTSIPGHIILDTKTLVGLLNIDLLTENNKILTNSVCYNNYLYISNLLWSKVFNMKKSIFKNKIKGNVTYIFNYMIQTDGYSCSLIFVRSDCKKMGTIKSDKKSKIVAILANTDLDDFTRNYYEEEYRACFNKKEKNESNNSKKSIHVKKEGSSNEQIEINAINYDNNEGDISIKETSILTINDVLINQNDNNKITVNKKRGRPKNSINKKTNNSPENNNADISNNQNNTNKKRGRPNNSAENIDADISKNQNDTNKKRGRSKK